MAKPLQFCSLGSERPPGRSREKERFGARSLLLLTPSLNRVLYFAGEETRLGGVGVGRLVDKTKRHSIYI